MARSYKKNPIIKYAGCRWYKNYGNRIVRRMHKRGDYSIPDGKAYRFTVEPWDIYDVVDHTTWEEWKRRCLEDDEASHCAARIHRHEHRENVWELDLETEYRAWSKCYRAK